MRRHVVSAGSPPAIITSSANPLVKDLVRLRRRPCPDRFLIEGYRELRRAVDGGVSIERVLACPALFLGPSEHALITEARRAGARLTELSEQAFRRISARDRPEGLAAVGRRRALTLAEPRLPRVPLILVADSIQKPGNLGALFRTAAAAGVDVVLVTDGVTDPFGPNAIRASLGAVFAVPVVECASAPALEWLRSRSIRVVAATPDESACAHWSSDLTAPTAVVIGSEQRGLPARWIDAADVRVRVPMRSGGADSLNAAAAGAVVLFEAVRQRAQRTRPPA